MTISLNNKLLNNRSHNNWMPSETNTLTLRNGFILLFFVSAVVVAQNDNLADNLTRNSLQLPETYRTPLSDMVHQQNKEWRIEPEEDNPWRENDEELIIKPRLKAEFFPEWDYDTMDDPTTRSLFQNEYELEKPRTNIFKYTF